MLDPKNFPKVPNPQMFADPDKIRFKELYKYQSLDMLKIADSMKNYKKSIVYIGFLSI